MANPVLPEKQLLERCMCICVWVCVYDLYMKVLSLLLSVNQSEHIYMYRFKQPMCYEQIGGRFLQCTQHHVCSCGSGAGES